MADGYELADGRRVLGDSGLTVEDLEAARVIYQDRAPRDSGEVEDDRDALALAFTAAIASRNSRDRRVWKRASALAEVR